MKNVYIVCWANAGADDNGNQNAFANVHGVYSFLDDAKNGLVECKDEFLDEIINNPDYDEEARDYISNSIQVYGSVNDDYFEIDYPAGDSISELYITLVEKELND